MWGQFFCRGLERASGGDDFASPQPPVHPELLKELARAFVALRIERQGVDSLYQRQRRLPLRKRAQRHQLASRAERLFSRMPAQGSEYPGNGSNRACRRLRADVTLNRKRSTTCFAKLTRWRPICTFPTCRERRRSRHLQPSRCSEPAVLRSWMMGISGVHSCARQLRRSARGLGHAGQGAGGERLESL